MTMNIVKSDLAPKAIGPYAQAIDVNGWVFSSGQIPLNLLGDVVGQDIVAQTHQVLRNLQHVLNEVGCDFSRVVKTTVFLRDMSDFAQMNSVYADYFGNHTPARSTVEVARLPRDVRVEIEVIAKKGD